MQSAPLLKPELIAAEYCEGYKFPLYFIRLAVVSSMLICPFVRGCNNQEAQLEDSNNATQNQMMDRTAVVSDDMNQQQQIPIEDDSQSGPIALTQEQTALAIRGSRVVSSAAQRGGSAEEFLEDGTYRRVSQSRLEGRWNNDGNQVCISTNTSSNIDCRFAYTFRGATILSNAQFSEHVESSGYVILVK